MKTNWKKFSVLFIAALISVSCGSDNKATGDAVAPIVVDNTPLDPNTSGNSAGAKDFAGFIKEVEAGRFNGKSNISRVYTYRRTVQSSSSTPVHTSFWSAFKAQFSFNYYVCPGSNCPTNSNSSLPMRYVDANGNIQRNGAFEIDKNFGSTLKSLKANIVSLMKSAQSSSEPKRKCINVYGMGLACLTSQEITNYFMSMYGPYAGTYIQQALDSKSKMFTFNYNDYSFIVDLNYPLAANPVGLMDLKTGETYILIQ